jgi:hypothetical protein
MPAYGSNSKPPIWSRIQGQLSAVKKAHGIKGKQKEDVYLPSETGKLDERLEGYDTPARKLKRFAESQESILKGLQKSKPQILKDISRKAK